MIESPESPDLLEDSGERDADDNSGIFIVGSHRPASTESVTSAVIALFPDQVKEDSHFVTAPGPLKKENV